VSWLLPLATLCLVGCATAQMHTQTQLNDAALGCGLALGELIQDEAEKKLLITIRDQPSVEQRACVTRWAKRRHLKAVFVNMDFAS
jgi:hypothetical protein